MLALKFEIGCFAPPFGYVLCEVCSWDWNLKPSLAQYEQLPHKAAEFSLINGESTVSI